MRWLCCILCLAALVYTLASEGMVLNAGDHLPALVFAAMCFLCTLALYCMARGVDAMDFGRGLSARPRVQIAYAAALRLGFLILGLFAALMFPGSVLIAVSFIAMSGDFGTSVQPTLSKVFGFVYFAHYIIMPLVSGLTAFCLIWFAIKGRTTTTRNAPVPAPAPA